MIGAHSVFDVTLSSANTYSSFVDLGGAWQSVYLKIPTMTSGADFYLRVSPTPSAATGGGFRVMHPPVNTEEVQVQTFVIASSVTNRVVPIPTGFRHIAIEVSSAPVTSVVFQVICGN